MGYYTQYKLEMKGQDAETFFEHNKNLIEAAIKGSKEGYDYEYVFDACFRGETMKWYGHEVNMLAISRLFPDETFYLNGIGEGDGEWVDVWSSKFHNGEVETKDLAPKVELDDIWGE